LPLLKTFSSAILALTVSVAVSAQPQITDSRTNFDSTNKVFRLDGGGVSYIFGVNPKGELQQIYWGGRLAATDRLSAGRATAGLGLFRHLLHHHTAGVRQLGRGAVC